VRRSGHQLRITARLIIVADGCQLWSQTYDHESTGRFAAATAALEKARALCAESSLAIASLGHCCAVAGDVDRAHALLAELDRLAGRKYVSPLDMARIPIGLGDCDAAFRWLAKSLEDRTGCIAWFAVDPRFDSLRQDSRFARLVATLWLGH
jgi:hypothetical protein